MGYKNKEQQREYQRKWRQERRDAYLATTNGCVRCGSKENLEIDHIDSTKKVSHKIWSWSAERRSEELAKCQVLCRACHLKKSREEGTQPPARDHGNKAMYEVNGCRCDLCRKAHTEYQRAWRNKKTEPLPE